jgi:hypothetical protein
MRSGGVPESEGSASLEGSAGSDGGMISDGLGEVGSVVAVRRTNGPWGRPREPMEMHVVQRGPNEASDHHHAVIGVLFFFSLLLLMAR